MAGMDKMPRMDGGMNWVCQCGNENFPNRNFCNRTSCGMARPGLTEKDLQAQSSPGGLNNWFCECGNENFPNRLFCNRRTCGLAKPGLTQAELKSSGGEYLSKGSSMPQFGGKGGGNQAPREYEQGSWTCSFCGNVNFPLRTTCNGKKNGVCGQPREIADAGPPVGPPAASRGPNKGGGKGGGCGMNDMMSMMMNMLNDGGSGKGGFGWKSGGSQPAKPMQQPQQWKEGSWVCTACTNINFPNRDTCNKRVCGRLRVEVDGGPPPGSPGAQIASVQNLPAPEGSWHCGHCNNLNWPQRTTCNKKVCGLPRDESSFVAGF